MGFYAPDSLVHEAENRGILVRGVDVNASQVPCTVEDGAVRLGLDYIKHVPSVEMHELVSERERNGPFATLGELAGRVSARRETLEQLAWSGACDGLVGAQDTHMGAGTSHVGGRAGRRAALWQLGTATPAESAEGQDTQLALPLELPRVPALRPLGRWQRLIADYSTSGVTIGEHALAILRGRLTVPMLATSAQLARLPTGAQVAVAGLVIARQRPGTAKGTMFLLFEDEFGTINLVVPKVVYERHRHLARAEPLLLARGRLERSREPIDMRAWSSREMGKAKDGRGQSGEEAEIRPVINVIVRELAPLERFLPGGIDEEAGADRAARVHRLPGAEVGSSMRAVAPPVQSFAAGRRR
jgi:error-prone DNA polymerase